MISQAVEAELQTLLDQHADVRLSDGRQAVVRNGHLPERTVQTGIGNVEVKVRDLSGSGIRFNSNLLPPYLKRARSVEELLPWLYLKGISTGDFQESLASLLGDQAKGLSANTISRLKVKWQEEHGQWSRRDLNNKRYIYWWADGVYSNVRMDDRLCLLVIIGVTEHGCKELVAVEDGYRESTASWEERLVGLRERGLETSPKLAIGDGALEFWKAITKTYPATRHQRLSQPSLRFAYGPSVPATADLGVRPWRWSSSCWSQRRRTGKGLRDSPCWPLWLITLSSRMESR